MRSHQLSPYTTPTWTVLAYTSVWPGMARRKPRPRSKWRYSVRLLFFLIIIKAPMKLKKIKHKMSKQCLKINCHKLLFQSVFCFRRVNVKLFPYRKDHLPECTQSAGVHRGGYCWHSLQCCQLTTTHHHLEAQRLQDPGFQRRWASSNKAFTLLEQLSHLWAAMPSNPLDSLGSHLSASPCFPINFPHSSSPPCITYEQSQAFPARSSRRTHRRLMERESVFFLV